MSNFLKRTLPNYNKKRINFKKQWKNKKKSDIIRKSAQENERLPCAQTNKKGGKNERRITGQKRKWMERDRRRKEK